MISLRVKHGEVERRVEVQLDDCIGTLKEKEFHTEMSDNRTVRIIFKGKELKSEETFRSTNMMNDDICHVIIGPKRSTTGTAGGINGSRVSSGGGSGSGSSVDGGLAPQDMLLMAILSACILFWMLLYSIPELLSPSSFVLMTSITVVVSLISFFRTAQSL
jgi:hypothetical protein